MLLTLDSALGNGSVALFNKDKLLTHLNIQEKGAQAKQLVSLIEQALENATIAYSDINSIVCTIGPGGFTGIRIALAAARAIAFTAKKNISGVSTLSCLAYSYLEEHPNNNKPVCAVLPAGNEMVFTQTFHQQNLTPISDAVMVTINNLDSDAAFVTANVSMIYGTEHLPIHMVSLDAALVGRLATNSTCIHLLTQPEPLYIRPPDISTPKKIA